MSAVDLALDILGRVASLLALVILPRTSVSVNYTPPLYGERPTVYIENTYIRLGQSPQTCK
eukprot:4704516-Pleurochrysis_carterae.AAC.1